MKRLDRSLGPDWHVAVPTGPGIYYFYDAKDELIYIGKAINLRRRLLQYRNVTNERKYRKTRKIVRSVARLSWTVCDSHLDAQVLEIKEIQRWAPVFNVVAKSSARYPFWVLREQGGALEMALRHDVGCEPFAFGAFRSRLKTLEAFFAMSRLLGHLGHRDSGKKLTMTLTKGEYGCRFRQLKRTWLPLIARLLKGEDGVFLQEISLDLLDRSTARAQASSVQEDLRSLKLFFKEESLFLAQAIQLTGYKTYPIPQSDRDILGVYYREQAVYLHNLSTSGE